MCYGNVTINRKHKVYKTIGRTNEDIKSTECTLKSATVKQEFEQTERELSRRMKNPPSVYSNKRNSKNSIS